MENKFFNSKNFLKLVFWLLLLIIVWQKITNLSNNELSWDVFGYYLYLPATFIHGDFFLTDISWIHNINNQYNVSGTLYQLSHAPDKTIIYFFLMGTAVFYAPFFFIGHIIAIVLGYPTDGFSLPYQYSIAIGCIFYTGIGLWFVQKILSKFFNHLNIAICLIIIVLGTNYLHFVTNKNLETTNFLFTLLSINIWFTIKWHQNQRKKYLLIIAASLALTILVKPSEIFAGLIPLFWGVYNKHTFLKKWQMIVQHKKQFYWAILTGIIILSPQLIYWQITTGSPIYDSYKNPGIGLDLLSPHISNSLFSYRKGWLIYTPIMVFALMGFYFVYKENKSIFWALTIYFLLSFYIISSWTEWWYGAGYSNRPVVTTYAALAIPLGFTLKHINKFSIKLLMYSIFVLLIAFNLFQMWQFHNYILDSTRTTKAYYWKVFLKTEIPYQSRKLLLIERPTSGKHIFKDKQNYTKIHLKTIDWHKPTNNIIKISETNNCVFKLSENKRLSEGLFMSYKDITTKDHVWIHARAKIKLDSNFTGDMPCLVTTMARKKGGYCYKTKCLHKDSIDYNKWLVLDNYYLTPLIRSPKDELQIYIWHRGKGNIYIDNIEIDKYERKEIIEP